MELWMRGKVGKKMERFRVEQGDWHLTVNAKERRVGTKKKGCARGNDGGKEEKEER